MSLRKILNDLGIDGVQCEDLIKEYYQLVRMEPSMTMNLFIRQVKDTVLKHG